jgi:hypothetical protein
MTKLVLTVMLSLLTVPLAAYAPPPGATTLIAPYGNVVGTTMAFSWQAVPGATGYRLKIVGFLTALTAYGTSMELWYTAEQAGCATGRSTLPSPGTCTMMLTPPVVAGTYIWSVQTWGVGGAGPESELFFFVMKDPVQNWGGRVALDTERFSHALAKGHAYVDNETGLIWSQPEQETFTGIQALFACSNKMVGTRMGFRLPTRDELMTLVDPLKSNPSLPDGHPFILPATLKFWTHTREVVLANNATFTYFVDFFTGEATTLGQTQLGQNLSVWCVRGPAGR